MDGWTKAILSFIIYVILFRKIKGYNMFDIHKCTDKEKDFFFINYSQIINKDSSYKEYLHIIKQVLSFNDPVFMKRQANDNHTILSSILENYLLSENDKINLLKEMKNKGFQFHLISPKEVIESMNFFNVLNSTINQKNELGLFYQKVLSLFDTIDIYYYAFLAYLEPKVIKDLKDNNPNNIENKDIISSYFFDIMFKRYYAGSGSNKYLSMKKHLALMLLSKQFSLNDLKEGYLLAENNPKFKHHLDKPFPCSFAPIFKEDIKKFIFIDLEKQIILNSIKKSENHSQNKKRI